MRNCPRVFYFNTHTKAPAMPSVWFIILY